MNAYHGTLVAALIIIPIILFIRIGGHYALKEKQRMEKHKNSH